MIVVIPVLLSLLVAKLRGGNLSKLADVHFRYPALALVGLLIQILIFSPWWARVPARTTWTHTAYGLSMGLLLLVVWLNHRLPGMAILGTGLLLNALTIWVNGGQMPASLWALQAAGLLPSGVDVASWQSNNSILMNESTRLWFLGDVFAVPRPWPLSNVFSPGDVLISVGGIVFVLKTMRR